MDNNETLTDKTGLQVVKETNPVLTVQDTPSLTEEKADSALVISVQEKSNETNEQKLQRQETMIFSIVGLAVILVIYIIIRGIITRKTNRKD